MHSRSTTMWFFDAADPIEVLRREPAPDAEAAAALAHRLFPEKVAAPCGTATLAAITPSERLYIGCYPGVTVISSIELVVAHPSRLGGEWVRDNALFVGIDSEKAWGAYTVWEDGVVRRSLSATAVTILEDEGLPAVWERPFWAGEHPLPLVLGALPDPQSLPFDPQALADEAYARLLGFRRSRTPGSGGFSSERITLCGFDILDALPEPEPEPQPDPPAAVPVPSPEFVAPEPPDPSEPPRKRRWFRRKRR